MDRRKLRRRVLNESSSEDVAALNFPASDLVWKRLISELQEKGNESTVQLDLVDREDALPYSIEPYVLTGYRKCMSVVDALRSIFCWHNQTMNIWTSIFLFVFNLGLTVYFSMFTQMLPPIFMISFWIQGLFRAYCWYNSFIYHTVLCCHEDTARYWCKLDYIGCYLTPLGMGTNIVFIELYCRPTVQAFFLLFGFAGIMGAVYVAVTPAYESESYRILRVCLSLSSTLPYFFGLVTAVVLVHDLTIPTHYAYLLYAFLAEMAGGMVYVSMFPERYFPRIFDNLLPSHSIWHWMNLFFDMFMMMLSYHAFVALQTNQMCLI